MSAPPADENLLREVVEYGLWLYGDADNFNPPSVHFRHAFSAFQYMRICGEAAGALGAGAKILDWGCGWGQNTFLLSRLGLKVSSLDVRPNYESLLDRHLPLDKDYRVAPPDAPLPYEDEVFDGVLSCGVLEHVPDDRRSALDVHRVLKKGGFFFIHHLPNRYSATEFFAKLFGQYHHLRKYTIPDASRLLQECGFEILRARRHHFLPRNIIETPLTRPLLNRHYAAIEKFDDFLSRLPILRTFCTAIEILARK